MTHRFVRNCWPVFALAALPVLGACSNGGSESQKGDPAPVVTGSPVAPGALDAAHKAYLDGDFLAMGERIRDVILDPSSSELVKENAYELLDKAYEATKGKLPSRFTLPAGYLHLHYGPTRGMTPHGRYNQMFLRIRARDAASRLKGLTLRRLGSEQTLLDKQSGNGTFDVRSDEPGYKDSVLELKKLDTLPSDGVFTLRLELEDGTVSEGWFIAHGLTSSASPEVKSPVSSASLSDPHPVVSWVPFRSPEYSAFESRTMNVWLSRDGDDSLSWNFWTGEPGDLGAVRVGDHPGAPQTKLLPGDYWVAVTAGENRSFGPVQMQRGSQTARPFSIR